MTQFCVKTPLDVPSNVDIISSVFSLKHLRCLPSPTVPKWSVKFPRTMTVSAVQSREYACHPYPPPPPPQHTLGGNIDRCIAFQFYLKLLLVFPLDYPFWTSLRTRCDSVSPVLCTKYSTPAIVFVQPLNLFICISSSQHPNMVNSCKLTDKKISPYGVMLNFLCFCFLYCLLRWKETQN